MGLKAQQVEEGGQQRQQQQVRRWGHLHDWPFPTKLSNRSPVANQRPVSGEHIAQQQQQQGV